MRILSSLLCLFLGANIFAGSQYNHFVVFGDSLSDNGNLWNYMNRQIPISPPYYEGRFSNGPTWVERLAKSFRKGAVSDKEFLLDYAFGGAAVFEADDDEDMFTLRNEVKAYLAAHNDKADPNSLYVIWIGANNYLAMPEDADKVSDKVVLGMSHSIETLMEKGAKHFLILNLPDLGITPIATAFGEVEKMHDYSAKHNAKLAFLVKYYQDKYKDVEWVYYDVESFLNKVLANPKDYGVMNATDTCYEAAIEKGDEKPVMTFAHSVKRMVSNDVCEGYLFFDPVHPTQIAHEVLAYKIQELLVGTTDSSDTATDNESDSESGAEQG